MDLLEAPYLVGEPIGLREQQIEAAPYLAGFSPRAQLYQKLASKDDPHVVQRQLAPPGSESLNSMPANFLRRLKRVHVGAALAPIGGALAADDQHVQIDGVFSLTLRAGT